MTSYYLRPLGLTKWQADFDHALLPLSDTGLGFALVEVIMRDGSIVRREVVPAADIVDESHDAIAQQLQNLVLPRADFGGLNLSQPRLMGILNTTPDSFSDGGAFLDADDALDHAARLIGEGVDLIDIGGESTRPKSESPLIEEELRRVIPVVQALQGQVIMSVDTRRTVVMHQAIQHGAAIINDVSALTHDPNALPFLAKQQTPVILMHMQGTPETMQDNPHYEYAALDVFDQLARYIYMCEGAGLPRDKIVIDPGIGFGKTQAHNLDILTHLSMYHSLGCGLLVGLSRKSTVGKIINEDNPRARVLGSVGGAIYAASQGAQILRVHDVKATKQALDVWRAF